MLTIKNLSAGYGKVQVLHGISLEVPRGRRSSRCMGANGAGKTTTMLKTISRHSRSAKGVRNRRSMGKPHPAAWRADQDRAARSQRMCAEGP